VSILLGAIKDNEEYAGLAAQHLAEKDIQSAIEPICDRLRSSSLQEVDLIISLIDSLNKLNSQLPPDLLQHFGTNNIPWQIKTKLEAQYLSAKIY
ncbi:MAG: hypothetical protein AAFR77_17285, partial [Cyanobacteria bacterium J06631_2]